MIQFGTEAGLAPDRRYRVPGAVRAGSLPASLLGAPALWPLGPEELGELLEQLRVLTGLPRPAPPATTVLLAPPPAPVPDRSQAGSGPGPAGVKFRRQLDRLVDFAATHGRLPSTGRSAPVQERRLGTWLCRQRRRHRDGTAPEEEATLLSQALHPGWTQQEPATTGRQVPL
ncbi:hypothetical protein SAT01_36800 [Sinomonas atrocyanea]|uniref:helicase associated domain-containing protein n=1 Tax=Sinomonas atrocyanea TaxID=37927 RepID=UPI001143BF2B|nr:helicase associated domain-containing protein [Sinomonas atrocyanea]GEB66232.1 hypothetical protein SAT01_36800 [Sinomonas atrocyanea]